MMIDPSERLSFIKTAGFNTNDMELSSIRVFEHRRGDGGESESRPEASEGEGGTSSRWRHRLAIAAVRATDSGGSVSQARPPTLPCKP